MGMFDAINISASALHAQRVRMDVIAQNIANANTTRTEDGTPYRRKIVVFEERKRSFGDILNEKLNASSDTYAGVRVKAIIEDTSPFKKVYDPTHPDSDQNGYVNYPNVDIVTEMVNMIEASRAYEANVTAMNITKSMITRIFEIGK
ncbi:flagellar basal body rod protein FlgC [Caldicellulosiruptor changbaiensis]|uniref:Flagellar basal body rod protein FlgB n=1 Tax=Caldicellulosiruptor changbaiensis TaxID=1222016 RepID=A0A3T0D473_9FIRM|nr:flagellar basal body rod protein FlgC [Caldicellulosiruptor changbaiensis]AZT89753.1 flagellar basal body rod protein FlgC [Caldicellulosiruptor changbaiensis]